jgi:GNAT superfamily N-acetyltransferase
MDLHIRPMRPGDPVTMARAFAAIGWPSKSEPLFERYLGDQEGGGRDALLALSGDELAGYLTIDWRPTYPPLVAAGIPEIQDLNVLPAFRRQRIATRLLDRAEGLIAARARAVGLAVGLHPGYNAAQRLYVLRGYVPDGNGVTVGNHFAREGQTVVLDDEVVLHLIKHLPARSS